MFLAGWKEAVTKHWPQKTCLSGELSYIVKLVKYTKQLHKEWGELREKKMCLYMLFRMFISKPFFSVCMYTRFWFSWICCCVHLDGKFEEKLAKKHFDWQLVLLSHRDKHILSFCNILPHIKCNIFGVIRDICVASAHICVYSYLCLAPCGLLDKAAR